jgi:hypothetical protein
MGKGTKLGVVRGSGLVVGMVKHLVNKRDKWVGLGRLELPT